MPGRSESRIMGPGRPGTPKKDQGLRQIRPVPGSLLAGSKRRSLNLEELYERHGERLYRYLLFKLGSAEDAEDALQEAFCRFARYDLRWRFVRDPRAFVFRVARNEANRLLRRRVGRREGEKVIVTEARTAFEPAFAAPEDPSLSALLQRAEGLPAEQKEAVFLKVFYGLTFKEIGLVCGVTTNTAASRYRYGIEKLREAAGVEP